MKPRRGQAEQTGVDEQHDGREPRQAADGVAVGVRAPGESFVETFEEPAEQAVEHALKRILLRAARLEEERGERGRKRERVERGDRGRDRDRERELPEECAR